MKQGSTTLPVLSRHAIDIAHHLGGLPGVIAVALGGSAVTGRADAASDLDFYVFAPEPPPVPLRRELAERYDPAPELDNQAFGPGDEWGDRRLGRAVDVIYWSPDWIEAQLDRVLIHHLPSTGYSTCFWRTVRDAVPLVDPNGWFAALQLRARVPYPEPLRQAIIANNRPLLRDARSSFLHQIERAIAREDAVSVQHRSTAFLASWFDVLFAINRVPHPGEKRLLEFAHAECPALPPDLDALIGRLIAAVPPPRNDGRLVASADLLVVALEPLLADE